MKKLFIINLFLSLKILSVAVHQEIDPNTYNNLTLDLFENAIPAGLQQCSKSFLAKTLKELSPSAFESDPNSDYLNKTLRQFLNKYCFDSNGYTYPNLATQVNIQNSCVYNCPCYGGWTASVPYEGDNPDKFGNVSCKLSDAVWGTVGASAGTALLIALTISIVAILKKVNSSKGGSESLQKSDEDLSDPKSDKTDNKVDPVEPDAGSNNSDNPIDNPSDISQAVSIYNALDTPQGIIIINKMRDLVLYGVNRVIDIPRTVLAFWQDPGFVSAVQDSITVINKSGVVSKIVLSNGDIQLIRNRFLKTSNDPKTLMEALNGEDIVNIFRRNITSLYDADSKFNKIESTLTAFQKRSLKSFKSTDQTRYIKAVNQVYELNELLKRVAYEPVSGITKQAVMSFIINTISGVNIDKTLFFEVVGNHTKKARLTKLGSLAIRLKISTNELVSISKIRNQNLNAFNELIDKLTHIDSIKKPKITVLSGSKEIIEVEKNIFSDFLIDRVLGNSHNSLDIITFINNKTGDITLTPDGMQSLRSYAKVPLENISMPSHSAVSPSILHFGKSSSLGDLKPEDIIRNMTGDRPVLPYDTKFTPIEAFRLID